MVLIPSNDVKKSFFDTALMSTMLCEILTAYQLEEHKSHMVILGVLI